MYYSTDTAKTWTAVDSVKGLHGMLALNADGSVFFHKPENAVTFWRSIDKGKTWSQVKGLSSQSQYAPIVADQVNPHKLYLLDNMGDMYASTDAGATFSKIGSVVNNAQNLYSSSTMKIRTVPGKEGEIWVPLDQNQPWVASGYSENGLAYTTDGGKTFTRFPSVRTCVCIGLGKAKEGSSYYTLYMWGATKEGPIGIYRSTDKGISWERINDDQHQFGGPGMGNFIIGDMNVYGRVYMSGAGRGMIYGDIGEPISNVTGKSIVRRNMRFPGIQKKGKWLLINTNGYADLVLEIMDISGRVLQVIPIKRNQQRVNLEYMQHSALVARLRCGNQQLECIQFVAY
jgi:hypothetical protein